MVGGRWSARRASRCPSATTRGSIVVNMAGKRFMNESMAYVDACHTRTAAYTVGARREHPRCGWCSASGTATAMSSPKPNQGEMNHGPFYTAKMVPGDLGPKGGIRTRRARPGTAGRRLGHRGPLCR